MFGSEMLEVAIGIIFVFLLVSILCSAVREGIEGLMKSRAAYLEHAIRELLHDPRGMGLANDLYNHPLIFSLFSGEYPGPLTAGRPSMFSRGARLPSYIPAQNFAQALIDLAARGEAAGRGSESPEVLLSALRENARKLRNPAIERVLLTAIDSAEGDLDRVRENIEAWYDSAMDRISGVYRRSTQGMLLGIGLVLAVLLNINTITVAEYLYRNDMARAALVARAETAAADAAFLQRNYREVRADIDELSLPIGWTAGWGAPRRGDEPGSTGAWNNIFTPILGWLITAVAAMLGAPFWFDVLNKVMVIRSTVKPHEKSPEESSEDRQLRAGRTRNLTVAVEDSRGNGEGDRGRGSGSAVGGTGEAAAPPLPPPVPPGSPDGESEIDACDIDFEADGIITRDEELPAAKGGVA